MHAPSSAQEPGQLICRLYSWETGTEDGGLTSGNCTTQSRAWLGVDPRCATNDLRNPLLCAKCCSRIWGPSREQDRNEYIPVPALKESLVKETDTQTCHDNPGLGVSVSSVPPSSSSSSSTSTPIYQTPVRTFRSLSLNSPARARNTLIQTHRMMVGIYPRSSGGKTHLYQVPFNQQIRERGRKKSKLFLVHAEGGWMEEKLQWVSTDGNHARSCAEILPSRSKKEHSASRHFLPRMISDSSVPFHNGNPEVWGWGTCDSPTVTLLSPGRDKIEARKTQLPGSWMGIF
ncbi:uncharacterized protein [Kogia breviceps]|uniref:uncharacterized protein isoform X2 n=1 Tax=Kogia breviceps TaxID=27615 RepID=UPI0034D32866